jgi:pimeloyl-ACP methyl ester carboxylesterase
MDFDYVVMPAIILAVGILVIWLSVRRMRSLSAKHYRTWRKVTERIVLSIIALLAVAVAGTSALNAIALHHFWALNPAPGAFYAVNSHRMHIYCMGNGSPAIVLEAGGGNDSVIWRGVQPALSMTTRVCAYDRAGSGWSDALSSPRDADHIADELHQLLLLAGITGPIVLMGHSIGGVFIRDYATRYPAEVTGLIFVDSSTPLQNRNPAFKLTGGGGPPPWVFHLALIAGVPRLIGMCSGGTNVAGDHIRKLQAEATCRLHYSAMSAEVDGFDQSGQETVHSGPYGSLPILIISHDPSRQMSRQPTQLDRDREIVWSQMQEDLKKLSTRSRRIIAKGSSHPVMLDRPDLIDKEVPLFIEQLRGTVPQPTNYGSTISE